MKNEISQTPEHEKQVLNQNTQISDKRKKMQAGHMDMNDKIGAHTQDSVAAKM